ncbi:MAG TPA: hypothetical protein VGN26_03990 [Armatimonadota bacterium]|jgi:hypothetical protein
MSVAAWRRGNEASSWKGPIQALEERKRREAEAQKPARPLRLTHVLPAPAGDLADEARAAQDYSRPERGKQTPQIAAFSDDRGPHGRPWLPKGKLTRREYERQLLDSVTVTIG